MQYLIDLLNIYIYICICMQHANKNGAIDHPKLMRLARNPVMLSVVTGKPLGKCFKTPLVSGMEDISPGANQADGQNTSCTSYMFGRNSAVNDATRSLSSDRPQTMPG